MGYQRKEAVFKAESSIFWLEKVEGQFSKVESSIDGLGKGGGIF